ncbi:MAG: DUF4351 domain-containing protein [Candidatus Viridilinea halotolerans]|uniref:DUF4351 domain-containing protein n=1 Tax=Candidatus Viridilinea halotolerans TaxID=2491704 RepID=A0A426TUL2_9CHLR|nr:MAG: DUF4351 domain-containing protein [Candidatus Viridilinea halotolerans]
MPYISSVERIGIKKGRVEGRIEERQELVLRLLTRRCGEMPQAVQARVLALTPAQLLVLSEDLLDFGDLAALTAWLDMPPS